MTSGLALRCLLCALGVSLAGCGSKVYVNAMYSPPIPSGAQETAVIPPAISAQPAGQSVPMGLGAAFSVTASGSSLHYQWTKNGAPILGATASSYVTPATAFADTGASYKVSVGNSVGTIASDAATLTVTARAPMTGDLRFQQVDAPSTVNGWGNAGVAVGSDIPGRGAYSYSPAIGSSLFVGSNGDCSPPTVNNAGVGCAWFYREQPYAASAGNSLTAGYGGDLYENFQSDLTPAASLFSFNNGVTPASPDSVVTSLDLEPANDLFAISWEQLTPPASASATAQVHAASAQQSGFVMEQNTVAAADLQAAIVQEGLSGRVVTALSDNGGPITYLAYGWQADTATLYEAQAVTASTVGAPAAAAALAAQGYIITAIGRADTNGNIVLIGTRVQGDTMPRPFMTARSSSDVSTLLQRGYSIVGVIFNSAQPVDYYTYLGER